MGNRMGMETENGNRIDTQPLAYQNCNKNAHYFMCRTEVDSVYYLVEIAPLVGSNGSGVVPHVSSGQRCSPFSL